MTPTVQDYAGECMLKGMRGDYSACRADFTVDQTYEAYGQLHHDVWRMLSRRQSALAEIHAHEAYLSGLHRLGLVEQVPDFDEVSVKLRNMTGWSLVPVPGLIPAEPFFDHLANRRFPVTNWLRPVEELDYIVEPDMFHDFFGHVPMLTNPMMADFMQLYGARALHAIDAGGEEMITRLYWYTAEYGLIHEPGQPLKAFGAGLMSSASELPFAMGPKAKTHAADPLTIMRTGYEINKFQRVYFVQNSFKDLFESFERIDMAAAIASWRDEPAMDPDSI